MISPNAIRVDLIRDGEDSIIKFTNEDDSELILEMSLGRVEMKELLETLLMAEKEDRDEYMIYDFQSNSIN